MLPLILSAWALLAAAPARCELVDIPTIAGWKIEAPDGFRKAGGSECDGGEKLCFLKGKSIISVNPVKRNGSRCGFDNEEQWAQVTEGSAYGLPTCELTFRSSGNKSYRMMIQSGMYMELLYKFKVAASDADNKAAGQAFDDIKSTLQPPPPPPKPEKKKEASKDSKKEDAPAASTSTVIVPDTNGWHFTTPDGFEASERSLSLFATFKRTEGAATAWIDFQFAVTPDEMCAQGGYRVGDRYESQRWDRHCFRSACLDLYGKAKDGRQLKAHSSEFLLEVEADRFIRTRLHYMDADMRSLDDRALPASLKEQAEKSFERMWRSLAPKGIEVDLDGQ
jgi:hypothetical protein